MEQHDRGGLVEAEGGDSGASGQALLFEAMEVDITPLFWEAFTQYKLHTLKLNDEPLPLLAYFNAGSNLLTLDRSSIIAMAPDAGEAFASSQMSYDCAVHGLLYNYNTIEEFKAAPKQRIFEQSVDQLIGTVPALAARHLLRFVVFSFADLKKYTYVQWPAIPAAVGRSNWIIATRQVKRDMADLISVKELEQLKSSWSNMKPVDRHVFVVQKNSNDDFKVLTWLEFVTTQEAQAELGPNCLICFVDPSDQPVIPGWPLRNLLFFLERHIRVRKARIVSFRDTRLPSKSKSFYFDVALVDPKKPVHDLAHKVVGWGRNRKGKVAPDVINLASTLDSVRLADSAVQLNLQLMKWRVAPALNLDVVRQGRCLLIGAGTLGCYVARVLMGWGVSQISFVDSGKVSFSNPVRQPLFEFTDSQDGGRPKAQAAADACRRIAPAVDARAYNIMVPMAGHPLAADQAEAVKRDARTLEELVKDHDIVFLLTDSRESRWFPTLLGACHRKLVITAALGFDSYVVMRHGIVDGSADALGCYFCNDVVAPTDSTTGRTLDQMCTVTRPGLAPIASSCAVELMVSVMQSPQGARVLSPVRSNVGIHSFDYVPHQIRGSLSTYSAQILAGSAYERCTACSLNVQESYRSGGFDKFLVPALNSHSFLEDITGLTALKVEADRLMDQSWDESDDNESNF